MPQYAALLLFVHLSCAAVYDDFVQRQTSTSALSTIERVLVNDELKCIPRLLCEHLAGGKPGQLRGFQVDIQSLIRLLQYLGIEAAAQDSPMFGMGQAVLTGIANKGDPYACYKKYLSCPKDQARLLYYLNNHRGGFFRGFNHPHYGRSESRIVNQNKDLTRPIVFEKENSIFKSESIGFNKDTLFLLNRRPKSFNTQPAFPTDRLPNALQFPHESPENSFSFPNAQHLNFFPN